MGFLEPKKKKEAKPEIKHDFEEEVEEETETEEPLEVTPTDVLDNRKAIINHEQRIIQMEAKWFRLGGL